MKKLVILCDNPSPIGVMRGIGAYRLRTAARAAGYQAQVIDLLGFFIEREKTQELIDKYIDSDTVVAFSTTWFRSPPTLDSSLSGSILDTASRNKMPARSPEAWFSFLKRIKNTGATVVFGGSNIYYFLNQQHQGLIDFFVVGFGDKDIVNLMNLLDRQSLSLKYSIKDGFRVIRNDNNFSINDIATEFLPEDHLNYGEVLPIEISRGCRFKCKFCYYPLNGRKKNDYIRESDDLYSEFMRNYEKFGTTKYRFLDDTYNESAEKLELVNNVISRLPFKLSFESYIRHELLTHDQLELLKDSGLVSAILGIETLHKPSGEAIGKGMAADKTLEIVHNLRSAIPSCYIATGMILGLPDDHPENIQWAFDIALRNDLFDKINWYPLVMRNKSELFQLSELEEKYTDYGYTVSSTDTGSLYADWQNKHGMTWAYAISIVEQLEKISQQHGTFSPTSRYALTIDNIGIQLNHANVKNFDQLDNKILYNTLKYQSVYLKKILEK